MSPEDPRRLEQQLEGSTSPMPFVIEAGEEGGTLTAIWAAQGEDMPLPYTYSEGNLSIDHIVSQDGAQWRLVKDAQVRRVDDGLQMTGTWSMAVVAPEMDEIDGFVLMRGTWQASKAAADGG